MNMPTKDAKIVRVKIVMVQRKVERLTPFTGWLKVLILTNYERTLNSSRRVVRSVT